MTRSLTLPALTLLASLACAPQGRDPTPVAVLEARVGDALGGVWSPEQSPRSPHLSLHLSPETAPMAGRIFWVRGDAEEALLDDLADPPLRETTAARLLEYVATPGPAGVSLQLAHTLPAYAQTTVVVWTGPEADGGDGFWRLGLRASPSPAAGATFAQSLPPDGAAAVSIDTRRALLRWDGYVEGLDDARAELAHEADVREVALSPFDCALEALPAGSCAWVDLDVLAPGRPYELRLVGLLDDATGTALPPVELRFRTAVENVAAPALHAPNCALDEIASPVGCARATRTQFVLRTATDQPALVVLSQGYTATAALSSGSGSVTLQLPVGGAGEALLEARDLTGRATREPLEVWLEADLPEVRLVEALAAPLGSDARSEYVEVVNEGEHARTLTGWALAKGPGSGGIEVLGTAPVPPGSHALLVGPDFTPETLQGLPQGLPRLALARSPSLPGGGVELLLRDARDRRVAQLRLPDDVPAGRCARAVDTGPALAGACQFPEESTP